MFIDVMLADKLPDLKEEPRNLTHIDRVKLQLEQAKLDYPQWWAEEKVDGHRIVVRVGGSQTSRSLFEDGKPVRAWSRDAKPRILPAHIRDAMSQFPDGLYDGELHVPGQRSFNVTELEKAGDLVFTIFDTMELCDRDVKDFEWIYRRKALEGIFQHPVLGQLPGVRLIEVWPLMCCENVLERVSEVWNRGGEGLILKKATGLYVPRKRSKNWLKIKDKKHATLKVVGFLPGKMGPYSRVLLQDKQGIRTTVKVKNTEWRNRIEADPASFIGRNLVIEFQEHTPEESYRHGMWDRFDDE